MTSRAFSAQWVTEFLDQFEAALSRSDFDDYRRACEELDAAARALYDAVSAVPWGHGDSGAVTKHRERIRALRQRYCRHGDVLQAIRLLSKLLEWERHGNP